MKKSVSVRLHGNAAPGRARIAQQAVRLPLLSVSLSASLSIPLSLCHAPPLLLLASSSSPPPLIIPPIDDDGGAGTTVAPDTKTVAERAKKDETMKRETLKRERDQKGPKKRVEIKKHRQRRWRDEVGHGNEGDCNQSVGLSRAPHGLLKLSWRTNKLKTNTD